MPLQPPPMFFTHDHHPMPIVDHYKGRSAFLIASGPSLCHGQDIGFIESIKGIDWAKTEAERAAIQQQAIDMAAKDKLYDLAKFYEPGIWSMSLNNAVRVVKSDAWALVDDPQSFLLSNWLNPKCMKFVPICHTQKTLFDNNAMKPLKIRTMDCPNVVYFKRNEHFQAKQFLTEDTINWGCHKKYGGGRSIMFATIRILYLLGFRRIYLVGVDHKMSMDKNEHYAFAQNRAKGSVNGNNATYKQMKTRFTELKPYFEEAGLQIFNCNPWSGFEVFPHVSFDDAVASVLKEDMRGIDCRKENTEGLYDRKAKEKEKQKKKEQQAEAKADAKKYSDEERQEVKGRLDQHRAELDVCKKAVQDHKATSGEPKTEDEKRAWQTQLDKLAKDEANCRHTFRTVEDEKRIKWGEPPKWGLWKDGK